MGMQRAGRRRGDDLEPLVRKWVSEGAVRPSVAARFLASRRIDDRRWLRWEALGRPMRRATDQPA
jgi:hypothetical protein